MQSALQRVKSVTQGYWRSERMPHVELRSTYQSRVGYGEHLHQTFSIGAILEGRTLVRYRGQERLARTGELVLIEADAAHSCNPLDGRERSYHMLYLDTHWCLQRLSALVGHSVNSLCCSHFSVSDSALFRRYLELVDVLMHSDEPPVWQLALDAFIDPLMLCYCSPEPASSERDIVRFIRHRLQENLPSPRPLRSWQKTFACAQKP